MENIQVRISQNISNYIDKISYEDMVKLGLHYNLAVLTLQNTCWKEFLIFSIDDKDIGFAALDKLIQSNKIVIDLLYIFPEFRGNGYSKIILNKIIKMKFEEGFHKITIATEEANIFARKIYKSIFKHEATLKKEIFKWGKYQDRYIYSIWNEENL